MSNMEKIAVQINQEDKENKTEEMREMMTDEKDMKGEEINTDDIKIGKRWQRKRPSQNPQPCSHSNWRDRRKRASAAVHADSDFYYYAGFGPWRGKNRGAAGEGSGSKLCGATGGGNRNGLGYAEVNEENIEEYIDDTDSDCELAQLLNVGERKGGREKSGKLKITEKKPVKARSLTSLV